MDYKKPTNKNPTEWLTPKGVEEEYDIKVSTQAKLRMNRKIPYSKIGKFIRYNREDLNKWLEDNKVEMA